MSLNEELKSISGRKKRFILLRIIDVSTQAALQLSGTTRGTYNTWLQNPSFVELYRRRDELSVAFKQEALQLMRRDNQLQAVLLEEKIVEKMKAEIVAGEYDLIRTNLAREVYSKLINDLDYQPKALSLSWEQKVAQLNTGDNPPQIEGGNVIEGEIISETDNSKETEHTEGELPPPSEQPSVEAEEKAEEI